VWVLNKAGVKRELLNTVKARKLTYCGHTMRKQGGYLEKEIMQGTMPGVHRRGRPRTAWMDNIKTWTGLRGRVNQNDRGQGQIEKVRPKCTMFSLHDTSNAITKNAIAMSNNARFITTYHLSRDLGGGSHV